MRTSQALAVWRRAGFTGRIQCKVSLPVLDTSVDLSRWGRRAFPDVRHFILRHLPSAPAALEGASFTISANFYTSGGGVRRRVLCRWRFGESATAVLEDGARIWAQLSSGRYG